MSVLLIPNPTKDAGLAVTRQAAAVLAGLGVQVLMPQTFAGEDRLAGVQFCRRLTPIARRTRS